MAKNMIKLQLKGFDELVSKLEGLEGDVNSAVTEAMEKAAHQVEEDTRDAIKNANLPAGGIYSQGDTEKSIVKNARVEWSGNQAEIGVGFDKDRPGAGGFLITGTYRSSLVNGTARMAPVIQLQRIYGGWARANNKYRKQLEKTMSDVITDYIKAKMEESNGG